MDGINIGGVIANIQGSVQMVFFHKSTKGAAFVHLQRWAHLKDHPAFIHAQAVLVCQGGQGGAHGSGGLFRLGGIAIVYRERHAFVFQQYTGNIRLKFTQAEQHSFHTGAILPHFFRAQHTAVLPALQPMIPGVHKAG
ncbi:MAG: hypothetical protein OHK0046_35870 [Anaerolineae bacterium]